LVIVYTRKGIKNDMKGKVIFISGCDTGFGNMLAKKLDDLGAHVIASCLTESGAKELIKQCSENLETVMLDITNQDNIDHVYDHVSRKYENGIYAIINNAGIAKGFFAELTPMSDYRLVMDINFFGHVAVTKKILTFN